MKKIKFFLPLRKLWDIIQKFPYVSATITSGIITTVIIILMICDPTMIPAIKSKNIDDMIIFVFYLIMLAGCLFLFFWWAFATVFAEKQMHELSQKALNSEIELMINTSLINNGSITKPEQMVKL